MADVKWIKLNTNIFDDDKMCILETCEEGIAFELIWIKLLCLAGKCNQDGCLMLSNGMPYSIDAVAKIFRFDIKLVKDAFEMFQELGMLELQNGTFVISNWLLHQNGKSLEDMRVKSRERQKRYRENQKSKASNVTDNVTSDVTNNATESISISKVNNSESYKTIIEYLNEKTGSHYKHTTDKTQRCIKARLNEGFTVDDFKTVIDTKCDEWLKKKDMAKYLRPETLFGTKFEAYLNQKGVEKNGHNKPDARRTNKDASNYWM